MDNVGLILAAGESRRMGKMKILMAMGEETILDHVVRRLSKICPLVLIVVSDGFNEKHGGFMEAFRQRHDANIVFIPNPSCSEGMHTSFQIGIQYLMNNWPKLSSNATNTTATKEFNLFMQPADMPFIESGTDLKLMAAATTANVNERNGGYFIPSHRQRSGHPICIPSEVCRHIYDKIPSSNGSTTVRTLLEPYSRIYIPVDDEGILLDIDTPEDYEHLVTYGMRDMEHMKEVAPDDDHRSDPQT